MFPEFDPAVAQVLAIVSRLGGSIGVDSVTSALAAGDDPSGRELSGDRPRVHRVLEGLRADGLLEADAAAAGRYHLTSLGHARLARTDEED